MATLLQAIGEVLRPALVQRSPFRLEETDRGSTCEAITLHKSGQAFLLKPDQSAGGVCPRGDCAFTFSTPNRLFPLFQTEVAGIAALCDYIVFCQENSRDDAPLFVLLCELKSGNVKGSRQQIENGRLLADYIVAMARYHRAVQPMPEVFLRGLIFSPTYSVPKGNLHKVRCKYAPLPKPPGGFADLLFARYACGVGYPLEHFCA